MGAMQDGRTILAWQIAAFTRQKKLKKLDLLIGNQKAQKGEPELKQFLMRFKGHSVEGEKKPRGD